MAEQNLWGVNCIWPFGNTKESQSNDKLEGFQICYPMTSTETTDKPTKVEKATRHVINMLNKITVDALKKFSEAKNVPAPTYSSYVYAKGENDWSYAVKPIYTRTKSKNRAGVNFIDPHKPQRAYIKLSTYGKEKKSNVKLQSMDLVTRNFHHSGVLAFMDLTNQL